MSQSWSIGGSEGRCQVDGRDNTHTPLLVHFFDVSGRFHSVFLAPMGAFGGQGHLGMVEALIRLITQWEPG